jgi:hypothetical protein
LSAGARTARMVNPLAWEKGLVLAQCSGCEAWHKLRDAGGPVQVYAAVRAEIVDTCDVVVAQSGGLHCACTHDHLDSMLAVFKPRHCCQ